MSQASPERRSNEAGRGQRAGVPHPRRSVRHGTGREPGPALRAGAPR